MSDPISSSTVTTKTSWFSRLGSSLKGLLFAILLFGLAIALLFWNEKRAVNTYQSLKEGSSLVVSIDPDNLTSDSEGKLVHFSGQARTPAILSDSEFGINQSVISLRRIVEMYQWVESSSSQTVEKVGGGQETTTTYSYEKKWTDRLIDSSQFHEASAHPNPPTKLYDNQEWLASPVSIGQITLPAFMLSSLNQTQTLTLNPEILQSLPYAKQEELEVYANHIYFKTENPGQPQIGNLRIRYEIVPLGELSVIAQRQGDTLAAYSSKNGRSLSMIQFGNNSAEDMFDGAIASNKTTTLLLRLAGILLLFIALKMFLQPLRILVSFLPFLGKIVGAGSSLIAALVATIIGLVVIAIAWLTARPLVAAGLLILAVGLVVGLTRLKKK